MPEQAIQLLSVSVAGELIPVNIEFRERQRLSISVHPDGSVTALAPIGNTTDDVLELVQRRHRWIAKQLKFFRRYLPLPSARHYVAGETHLYLGRQYRLQIHESSLASVKLVGRFFNASVPDRDDTQAVAIAMKAWYQAHAETIFRDRMQKCLAGSSSLINLKAPLRIRPMKLRWGSCSKAGTITLNTHLVKTPLHCIEYVILHELCHLRVHDHGPRFYRMLGRLMPDWKQRKNRLDQIAWI